MKKKTIIFIFLDIFVIGCFIVFYGPFSYFRNLIISTAMVTKTHQWIAYTLYSEKTVSKVVEENSYIPITDKVDLDQIVIDTTEKASYDNKYDEIILTRDPNNEDYKYIEIEVGGYKAHLVAIYDPSKVKLITSKSFNTGNGQEKVINICKRLNGKVCINGGAFSDPTGWGSDIPLGYLIKDNEIIWSDGDDKADLIGFTNDNKLLLVNATGKEALEMGMRDALQFGPFLIVNGEKIKFNSEAGGYDRAARVAIGQRKDGVVLFLVTEGVHTKGPNLKEVTDTLALYGAYNAANLDGGTSSSLVIENELMNNPLTIYGTAVKNGRGVVSGFGLLP